MEGSPRPFLFCLVPADQADALLAPLREHFAREPRVAVLVEKRLPSRDRRPSRAVVQGYQRAPVAERDPRRALPRELHHDARGLRFVQRMEPLGRTHEQTSTSELVPMIHAHDPTAVSELWWRVAERVHVRLRAWLGEFAAAQATPEMLGRILDELDRYDPERQPLTAWLDAVVDRYAEDRAEPGDPSTALARCRTPAIAWEPHQRLKTVAVLPATRRPTTLRSRSSSWVKTAGSS